jgi:hypothetical protein
MTISELIKHLTEIQEKEGDLVVAVRTKADTTEDVKTVPTVDTDFIGFGRRKVVVIAP